jgi:tripartite-type tricarboxylate transporter receptor subunit TctC
VFACSETLCSLFLAAGAGCTVYLVSSEGDIMNKNMKLTALVATAVAFVATAQAEPSYPSRPVTIIVPYAAGGNLDVTARVVTTAMGAITKQAFVIQNRPGAGGILGHQVGARSDPDGYTLVTTANGSFAYAPRSVAQKSAFKATDFAPIGALAITPLVLEVPADSRFKTFKAFLDYARANPGRLSIGHAGNGTTNQIAILLMQQATGAVFNPIPYKGAGIGVNDLLGHQLDAFVDQLPSSLPHIQAHQLRALALTTKDRARDLPGTATLQELGLKGFDISTTTGLLAPAHTPASIVRTLNRVLNQALAEPEVRKRLRDLGSDAEPTTPEAFTAYLVGEDAKAAELAKKGLLKPE